MQATGSRSPRTPALGSASAGEPESVHAGQVFEYSVDGTRLHTFSLIAFETTDGRAHDINSSDGRVVAEAIHMPAQVMAVGGQTYSPLYEHIPGPVGAGSAPIVLLGIGRASIDGVLREAGTAAVVIGAVVRLTPTDVSDQIRLALERHGVELVRTSVSDPNGAFSFDRVHAGKYLLSAHSPVHQAASREVEIDADRGLGDALELVPKESVTVRLVGVDDGAAMSYSVAHAAAGNRAQFGADGSARVLLESSVPSPHMTVYFPDDTELSALFVTPPASLDDGLDIRVGGGQVLTVTLSAPSRIEERLVLNLQYRSQLGYDVFLTRWITSNEPEVLTMCEPGVVWVDVGVLRDDRTLAKLARDRVEIRTGVRESVTIELGDERCYLRLMGLDDRPIDQGEVYLATPSDSHLSPTGGVLDSNGRLVVPARSESEFFLIGVAGIERCALVDFPVTLDTKRGGVVDVRVGEVLVSEVELLDRFTGAPLGGRTIDLVGGRTGLVAASYSSDLDGAPIRIGFYAGGEPRLRVDEWDVWSPREPIPLTAGRNAIRIHRRAYCTFKTDGRRVLDIRHAQLGLNTSALLADESVQDEEITGGRRFWGIPSGAYAVRLEGEDEWRGPFEVTPGEWCIVEVR